MPFVAFELVLVTHYAFDLGAFKKAVTKQEFILADLFHRKSKLEYYFNIIIW